MVDTAKTVPAVFDMGMDAAQSAVVDAAVRKFGSTWFTVGMFCEHTDAHASDCLPVFRSLVDIGVLRCPLNDGGCFQYEIIPEMVRRARAHQ